MNNKKNYTFITGASQGLGKSFAWACAKRGHNLLLVSLPDEQIDELAESIKSSFNVDIFTFETDLTDKNQLYALIDFITSTYSIDLLLNNAGMGGTKHFLDASEEYINRIILLNIQALVSLTHKLLPSLIKQPRAYILNVASMASFGPIPYKTIYPASKAFVRSFSRGLAEELKKTQVQVSVTCPGGMPTNKEVTQRIQQHNPLVQATILGPDKVAQISLEQMYKGKTQIIPGKMGKLSWLFLKYFPETLRLPFFSRNILKEMNA